MHLKSRESGDDLGFNSLTFILSFSLLRPFVIYYFSTALPPLHAGPMYLFYSKNVCAQPNEQCAPLGVASGGLARFPGTLRWRHSQLYRNLDVTYRFIYVPAPRSALPALTDRMNLTRDGLRAFQSHCTRCSSVNRVPWVPWRRTVRGPVFPAGAHHLLFHAFSPHGDSAASPPPALPRPLRFFADKHTWPLPEPIYSIRNSPLR